MQAAWTTPNGARSRPQCHPANRLGGGGETDLREVVNAILSVLRCGCPWRMLPMGVPPWRTVYRYFAAWRDSGLWVSINHRPALASRASGGRATGPSGGIVDSQSAKTTESGGPRGFDAGKKVKGRNRRLARDFEATVATARTWLFIGSVQILLRRLTRRKKTITCSETDTQVGQRRSSAPRISRNPLPDASPDFS